MNQAAKQPRISGVDICRSLAIALAMLSHVLINFSIGWEGPSLGWSRFAMQMAPPIFIVLFGSMLEIAYVRKVAKGDSTKVFRRLMLRAGQCYVLYCISILALVAAGHYSLLYGFRCMLLMGVTPFTDILKFYTLALFLAPLVIALRVRFGLWSMLFGAITIQALYPAIQLIRLEEPASDKDYAGPFVAYLYGGSYADVGGPSVLQGMTFVFAGVIVGRCIKGILSDEVRQRRKSWGWLAMLFIPAAAACMFFWTDTQSVLANVASLTYRNDNHPFYFALGTISTIIAVLASVYLFDKLRIRALDGVLFFGATSLFTFSFGNMLLYLQPWGMQETQSLALAAGFACLIWLQSLAFYRVSKSPDSRLGRLVGTITDWCNRRIRQVSNPVATAYSTLLAGILQPEEPQSGGSTS